ALRGIEPNPASSRVTVRFVLPVAAPATLEVLDLEGRRVALVEVGGLGPGAHAVVLDRDLAGLPTGLYAVRLRQLGQTRTLKLSLMR
ncbi:MAG: T9SS type A sorting domain-containing protein, partial [Candidatus Eisenbacteria bacterium]